MGSRKSFEEEISSLPFLSTASHRHQPFAYRRIIMREGNEEFLDATRRLGPPKNFSDTKATTKANSLRRKSPCSITHLTLYCHARKIKTTVDGAKSQFFPGFSVVNYARAGCRLERGAPSFSPRRSSSDHFGRKETRSQFKCILYEK